MMKYKIGKQFYNLHTKKLYTLVSIKGLNVILKKVDTNKNIKLHLSNLKNNFKEIF